MGKRYLEIIAELRESVTEKADKMTNAVRIPIHVGGGGGHGSHGSGFGMMEIALLVAAGGIAGFFLMRRRASAKAS